MEFPDGRLRIYEFNGETFSRGCLIGFSIVAIQLFVIVPIVLVSAGALPQAVLAIITLFSVIAIVSISTLILKSRKIKVSVGIVEKKVVIVCNTIFDRFVLVSPFIYGATIGNANLNRYTSMICYQLELDGKDKTGFVLKEIVKDNQQINAPITQKPGNELYPSAYTILSKAPYPGVAHKLYELLKEINHPDVVEVTQDSKIRDGGDVGEFDPFLE